MTFGIDNILVRSYDSSLDAGNTYYKVTYDVKGEKSEETGLTVDEMMEFTDEK